MNSSVHARRGVRGLAVTLLSTVALAVPAVPAQAQTWSYPDSGGDGARPIDIDSVRVANGTRAVVVKIVFQDLQKAKLGAATVALDTGRAHGEGHFVGVHRRPDGRLVQRRVVIRGLLNSDAPATNVRCRGLRYRWKSGGHWNEWLKIRIPHRCLRHSDRLRANVNTYTRNWRGSDSAPDTRSGYSAWVRRG